ncbi:polymerase [Caldimonas thermodepolymerans]|uniref:Polymerase n=1 Tax=Caldimonas thermodepolymerans TaxID=215580 RepID=A0A2S5T560_9BURK|nr:polymerase [Caldimonas thermodepolymerans]
MVPAPLLAVLLAAPYCLAYSQTPATTLLNSLLAFAAWGALLAFGPSASCATTDRAAVPRRWAVPALVAGACACLALRTGTLADALVLAAAAACAWAAGVARARIVWAGLLVAGCAGVAIALVQYFAPSLADGRWIAVPTVPGRAFGNLRQPNLFSTLLLLALCAGVWLLAPMRLPRWVVPAVVAWLLLGVALSSSRTGMVGTGVLVLWGLLDRGLPRHARASLLASVAIVAAWWALLWAWGHLGGTTFYAEARLSTGSDISSSRFGIWRNTLALVAAHPWTGVGWGDFNYAWTFSAFPGRPVAFFDHAHNLVLQLMVELGVPAALALLGALAWLLWRARGGLRHPDAQRASLAACCLAMLALLGWHSLLEYPLWYPYFLFPAAFVLGTYLAIGGVSRAGDAAARPAREPRAWRLRTVGALMVAGAAYAAWDYQSVVQIFAPYGAAGQAPLPERIATGQRSTFFAHHADYAAVTTAEHPSQVFDAFERPLHHLVDARLMIAYAKALEELGERDRAVYVAQRLREFRHPLGEAFFQACDEEGDAPLPFQCDELPRAFEPRELEPRAVRQALAQR